MNEYGPLFASRTEAAHKLAGALGRYRGQKPLVLAIPRGAIAMGRMLADELGGDLDVVLVHKLGAPHNAEFAVGSIDESGWTWLAPYAAQAGADDHYLAGEKERQLAVLKRRRALYTPARPPLDPSGRIAIVVDDGLATGATMMAALHAVRSRQPRTLVCAVPVAARDSLERVCRHADETVCLAMPDNFDAVGQFYARFPQIEDDEVARLLAAEPKATMGAPS